MKAKFKQGEPAVYKGTAVVIGREKYPTEYGQTYYYVRPIVAHKPGVFVRSDYLRKVN